VAARLSYWPNGVARSLITSRTNTLGVLLPGTAAGFFAELIRGVALAARRHGLHVLVSGPLADSAALSESMHSMSGRVDGMAVVAPDPEAPAAIREFLGHSPVVLLNPGQPVDDCDTLSVTNFEGALEMVRHLIGLGHRRIAMVRGPMGHLDADQRLEGYRAALREAHLATSPDLEVQGDLTEASGYQAISVLLARSPHPDAVFLGNDPMAIGALSALRDARMAVPEALAVAGFDDLPMASFMSPPLSTVHVNTALLGERAVELLMRAIRSGPASPAQHEVLPTSLAIRSSCGAELPRRAEPERWRAARAIPATSD
jgi:LacI family transcriptional regulator